MHAMLIVSRVLSLECHCKAPEFPEEVLLVPHLRLQPAVSPYSFLDFLIAVAEADRFSS
jgi:hypothetical protein